MSYRALKFSTADIVTQHRVLQIVTSHSLGYPGYQGFSRGTLSGDVGGRPRADRPARDRQRAEKPRENRLSSGENIRDIRGVQYERDESARQASGTQGIAFCAIDFSNREFGRPVVADVIVRI